MTFKINRIYYLLSREARNNLLMQLVPALLFIFLVATGGPVVPFVPVGLVVFLICFNLWLVLTRPKQIYLIEDHITLCAWFKKTRNSGGVIRFGRSRGVTEYKKELVLVWIWVE